MAMKKLIIETRINEGATKASNPHVPYTPDEIIAEALACAEAGASIVHFHARYPDGSESNEIQDYRDILAGIRAKSDVLIHPTLGQFQGHVGSETRLSHIRDLTEVSNLRPDIAPLDIGSNNLDLWDPAERKFLFDGFVYQNSTMDLREMSQRLNNWDITPQLVLWSVASARLMGALIDTGHLREPAFCGLFLAGEQLLAGHPATSAGLRAYLDNLPDRRIEWTALIQGTSFLPLMPEIISLGGHVSIGLGDHAYPELGLPSNVDLVRRTIAIASTMGREVASPQETRAMLSGAAVPA
jgi:uncharacterized protein (DUF849 family)